MEHNFEMGYGRIKDVKEAYEALNPLMQNRDYGVLINPMYKKDKKGWYNITGTVIDEDLKDMYLANQYEPHPLMLFTWGFYSDNEFIDRIKAKKGLE